MSAASAPAEEVLPHVYRIGCPFGDGSVVFAYYLDAREPALVDTGVKASPPQVIEPALAAAGRSLRDVRFIFNTHGHWDHMGGNGAMRALAPAAQTFVHRADRYLLETTQAHTEGYATYSPRLLGDQEGLARQQAMLIANIDSPTPVDGLVEDGQVFDLGGVTLRAIRTPGHSLGSTSYLLEDSGALITGDSVQGLGSRPRELPLVFDDTRAYRATIARLSELPLQALCMGHQFCGLGGDRDPVRRGAAARTFLGESGEAVKAVEEAMRSTLAAVAVPGSVSQTTFRGAATGSRSGDQTGLGIPAAGDFLAVARGTLSRLAPQLGIALDERGLNPRAMATLHAFYRELTGAPPPSVTSLPGAIRAVGC